MVEKTLLHASPRSPCLEINYGHQTNQSMQINQQILVAHLLNGINQVTNIGFKKSEFYADTSFWANIDAVADSEENLDFP